MAISTEPAPPAGRAGASPSLQLQQEASQRGRPARGGFSTDSVQL